MFRPASSVVANYHDSLNVSNAAPVATPQNLTNSVKEPQSSAFTTIQETYSKFIPWYLNNTANADIPYPINELRPLNIKINFASPSYTAMTTATPSWASLTSMSFFSEQSVQHQIPTTQITSASVPPTPQPSLENIAQQGKQAASALAEKFYKLAVNGGPGSNFTTSATNETQNMPPKEAFNQLFSAIYSLSHSMIDHLQSGTQ